MHGTILGAEFELTGDNPSQLDYANAFWKAYKEAEVVPRTHARFVVRVQERPVADHPSGERVPVHRSKHPYWSFDAVWVSNNRVVWPKRKIEVVPDSTWRVLEFVTDPALEPAKAGEALFHLCRSLAIYSRPPGQGNLLHASALVMAQRGILFCGGSNAGKTTLFVEGMARRVGLPLANDRVLVTSAEIPEVVSWPSYASFCEGTLMDYEFLRVAAEEYEASACPYRTLRWLRPLEPTYSKDRKRIYPMIWLANAVGMAYRKQAQLGAIVFTRLDQGVKVPRVQRLNLESARDREEAACELEAHCFDAREPSFRPWHRLALLGNSIALTDLVERCRRQDIHVYKAALRPQEYASLYQVLETLR